jgi:GTPase SAR1 family protein
MQVETRLESSLHNQVYIIPEQDKNPNQVEHPWSIDVKSGSKPKVRLSQNTHIITVFDQKGVEGRLLILGQPGAGKTTMLLELAQKLVERVENDLNEPIPILLSLSSWQNDQQSIKDWIVAELNSGKYYYKVRKDITKQWLEHGEIIPLLDGLDELAASRQESCVQKLNEFLQPGNWCYPLVVCSRIQEYQLYPTQLALNTSVELQPFTPEQVQDYLTRTGNHQLADSLRDDVALRELAQTPLVLNIIVISCQNLSLDKWQELKSSEERLDCLFSTYVEVMLGRRYEGKRPSNEKNKYWLSWLAGRLIEQNETEFFIEKMQPTWLPHDTQRKAYSLSAKFIVSLGFGLTVGLIGVTVSLRFGLCLGLCVGLFASQFDGKKQLIKPFESIHFSWKESIFWMSTTVAIWVIFRLFIGLKEGLDEYLIGGLSGGWSIGFSSTSVETKRSTNQSIWQSLQNSIILGLSSGMLTELIGWLMRKPNFALSLSICFGLFVGLKTGGIACIRHFTLRFILYHNSYIPWNYAYLLNYATNRLFLQRVGGGYRFMHDLLRQHFAANYR